MFWNNSSFRAPLFPVLHQIIVRVYKIWDVNLEQNFTQYTKKLVKITKKDVHFAYFEKKTLLAKNSATKWSHENIFSAKIFTVKNYTMSEVFRFIFLFYRVADILLGRPMYRAIWALYGVILHFWKLIAIVKIFVFKSS